MDLTIARCRPVDFTYAAPPSKSVTHRALIAAALSEGESRIEGPLRSGDTLVTARALSSFGVSICDSGPDWIVRGNGQQLRCEEGLVLDMENSGTSMRLLTPLALLCGTPVVFTGSPRMQERPIGPLIDALSSWGGFVRYLGEAGYPPFRISGILRGGPVCVEGSISSQFISALLMAAPLAIEDTVLTLSSPPVSQSYIDLTCNVMKRFGVNVRSAAGQVYYITAGQQYWPRPFRVEGDYSSASYILALAAVCGGRVKVTGLDPESAQGDRAFPFALEKMGCRVSFGPDSVEVTRDGPLHGITIDMSSAPDAVQTLCAVAACAEGPTVITGVSHLRFKESDRLRETADQLLRLGGKAEVGYNEITIYPGPLHGGTIDPGDDHRTAMSFAVLGSAIGDVTIRDAECVKKSFPGFWDVFREVTGS